jgi:hypothetical protein
VAALLAVVLLGSAGRQAAQAQSNQAFTIPAGGRAVIPFEAYCLDFGGAFPATLQAPSSLASNDVRGGLNHIQANNYGATVSKALQGQYGIWRLAGTQGSPAGNADANAVINAKGNLPPAPANATSIIDAANNGRVDLDTIAWGPASQPVEISPGSRDYFYGRGTLAVKNLTNQSLTLYMPAGAVFRPGSSGSQRMTGFQTGQAQIFSGSLPNTAAIDPRLMAGLLALGMAVSIHIWRRRRERLIGTRQAA